MKDNCLRRYDAPDPKDNHGRMKNLKALTDLAFCTAVQVWQGDKPTGGQQQAVLSYWQVISIPSKSLHARHPTCSTVMYRLNSTDVVCLSSVFEFRELTSRTYAPTCAVPTIWMVTRTWARQVGADSAPEHEVPVQELLKFPTS